MATKTKHSKGRPVSRPPASQRPPVWAYLAVGAGIVVLGVAIIALMNRGGGSQSSSAGLPNTPDYHSLLVEPGNSDTLLLGTHVGVYRSTDAGRHWRLFKLANRDAMNLARAGNGKTIWMAGHDVFARSDDGGTTWEELQPASLPSLDIHGFAVDPREPRTVYAAVAGRGLYRSVDRAATFTLVSRDVGGAVMALAVTPSGALLAGDMARGLLRSRNNGRTWTGALNAQLAGLAISPSDPKLILATGPGVLRSADGGRTWKRVLEVQSGAGPVAWSASRPSRAYVVGFDRTLYRSDDAGLTWKPAE
ncbi:MAG: WD40/YVTN/BNR-like repeat-containing protein [Gaiellaceae bacterium]